MSERVTFEADGSVAVITINRPEVRNAVDKPTAEEIAAALDELDSTPDLRVGIVTGAGGFFSAGMDLKALNATGERPLVDGRGAFGICERASETPLIAAVEGRALGGGFEIALACDLIVAARDAQFGLPEVKRGLVAAAGGVLRLPDRLPRNLAKELVLTGSPIGAGRAHELGLVSRLAEPGEALAAARVLAAEIAGNAPLAINASKQLIDESADWPAADAFDRQREIIQPVRESEDAKEGAMAFVEKRAPVWTGR